MDIAATNAAPHQLYVWHESHDPEETKVIASRIARLGLVERFGERETLLYTWRSHEEVAEALGPDVHVEDGERVTVPGGQKRNIWFYWVAFNIPPGMEPWMFAQKLRRDLIRSGATRAGQCPDGLRQSLGIGRANPEGFRRA